MTADVTADSNPCADIANSMDAIAGSIAKYRKVSAAMNLVGDELRSQDDKWGQQDHPIAHRTSGWMNRGEYTRLAMSWKRRNDFRVESDTLSWDGILLEEVFEALCETDTKAQEEELIQVAAVALQMVLCLQRKAAAKVEPVPAVEVEPLRRVPPSYPILSQKVAMAAACKDTTCCAPEEGAPAGYNMSTQYLSARAKPSLADEAVNTLTHPSTECSPRGCFS